MTGRSGTVIVGEEEDCDPFPFWTGRFSAHWESGDGDFRDGPVNVTAEEAIAWGRTQADVVLIRLGDSELYYSAGDRAPDWDAASGVPPVEPWDPQTKTERRREPGNEHLDAVYDEPIEWEVRVEPPAPALREPDHLHRMTAALDAAPGVSAVHVEPAQGAPATVRYVVRARSHQEALAQALRAEDLILKAFPVSPEDGGGWTAYFPTGLSPVDGIRPLRDR
jgi:hypothetical protein